MDRQGRRRQDLRWLDRQSPAGRDGRLAQEISALISTAAGVIRMIHFKEQPGLVLYLTCGDPSVQATVETALAAIDAGADVIELGVPFSDPVADGPVIQRASERALKHNTSVADVLYIAREIRKR